MAIPRMVALSIIFILGVVPLELKSIFVAYTSKQSFRQTELSPNNRYKCDEFRKPDEIFSKILIKLIAFAHCWARSYPHGMQSLPLNFEGIHHCPGNISLPRKIAMRVTFQIVTTQRHWVQLIRKGEQQNAKVTESFPTRPAKDPSTGS